MTKKLRQVIEVKSNKGAHLFRHGMSKSKTYGIWHAMKERCSKEYCKDYKYYGARGITYDRRWEDFIEFNNDMGEQPVGLELDRIDNNGDYCKENCRWITHKEQCNNRRKKTEVEQNLDRTCQQCGKKYLSKIKTSMYCCVRCSAEARRRRMGIGLELKKTCGYCGKEYVTTSPKSENCSRKCSQRSCDNVKLIRRRVLLDKKNGGRTRNSRGKYTGICKACSAPFEATDHRKVYCSRECKIKNAWNKRKNEELKHRNAHKTGEISTT